MVFEYLGIPTVKNKIKILIINLFTFGYTYSVLSGSN